MDAWGNRADVQQVSRSESEGLVAAVEQGAGGVDPSGRAGVFGPESASWKINRESALFLAAGRAALLQLAHPWVATALEQHSTVMARPIDRFHSTFRIVFTMIFGSAAQAAGASRHLHHVHTHIQGDMTEDVARWRRGERYEANEVSALRWVFATLIESAVLAYETVLSPLSAQELESYYRESKTMAALFGIPAEALPEDWNGFLAYCRGMAESDELGVTAGARGMAQGLLRGAGSWVKPPHWYRALTTAWLPERFRKEFELPFGADDEKAVAAARGRLSGLYRRLPSGVRFVGPWHEAQARLRGRGLGVLAQASNRFWMGQARMPFG